MWCTLVLPAFVHGDIYCRNHACQDRTRGLVHKLKHRVAGILGDSCETCEGLLAETFVRFNASIIRGYANWHIR